MGGRLGREDEVKSGGEVVFVVRFYCHEVLPTLAQSTRLVGRQ